MTHWRIISLDQRLTGHAFSLSARRQVAGMPRGTWSSDADQALRFARREDAEEFRQVFLAEARATTREVADA